MRGGRCAQHMLHGFVTARNDLELDESNPDEIFVLNLLRFKGIEGRMSYSRYGKVTQSLMKRDDVAAKGPVLMGHAWLGGGPGAPDPELATAFKGEDMQGSTTMLVDFSLMSTSPL